MNLARGHDQEPAAPQVRVRIDLGYDGTDFHGWATQPGLRTVQGSIEAALRVMVREPAAAPVLTVGGRTDAGVHARGQVAHVDLSAAHAHGLTTRRLRGLLARDSPDITIHRVSEVTHDFDARFAALSRRYEYRVADTTQRQDPLAARYTVHVQRELSLDLLQSAADELLGLNDFTSFCKAREGATAVRELQTFEWSRDPAGVYVARIQADAFCHSMVRALIGATTAVGQGKLSLADLRDLRDARERTNRFPVMPAHGLSLEEITYPDAAGLAARALQTRAKRSFVPQF